MLVLWTYRVVPFEAPHSFMKDLRTVVRSLFQVLFRFVLFFAKVVGLKNSNLNSNLSLWKLFYICDWLCFLSLYLFQLTDHCPSHSIWDLGSLWIYFFLPIWKCFLSKIILFPQTIGLLGIQRSKYFWGHNKIFAIQVDPFLWAGHATYDEEKILISRASFCKW